MMNQLLNKQMQMKVTVNFVWPFTIRKMCYLVLKASLSSQSLVWNFGSASKFFSLKIRSEYIRTVRPWIRFSFGTFDSYLADLGRTWV